MSELVPILEQCKLITNPQQVEVVNVFATSYRPMERLLFEKISGYNKPLTIVDLLPTVNPRDFGVDFISSYGKSSTYGVPWKNYGGKIEIDKALRKGNPAGAAMQELMQIQAIAKQWTRDFFEGQGGIAVTGVGAFLQAFWPGQIINAASTTAHGDLLTMDMMDAALRVCEPEEIYVSQIVNDRLTELARTNAGQVITWTENQFGAKVMHYRGIPVFTMIDDYDSSDVLSVTERDGANANSDTSSVWFINYGEDSITGFSPDDPALDVEVANPGTHVAITRVETNWGLIPKRPRAAARIKNIRQAVK